MQQENLQQAKYPILFSIYKTVMQQENLQQADKLYFKPGVLSPKAREMVLQITGGDNYTKIISDIYFYEVKNSINTNDILPLKEFNKIKGYYIQIKNYNKNVFPINNLYSYTIKDLPVLISKLEQRGEILELIKKLPSIAIRNLKDDFRLERDYGSLERYNDHLKYFISHIGLLNNRDERLQKAILNKMFKSNITLDKLIDFVEEKENLLGGVKYTKNSIKKIIREDGYDLELVYDSGNIMVVDVTGPDGIKKIGCNSVWCFTYGQGFNDAYRNWNDYSTNDHVYVIIDFSKSSDSIEFMYVLIKPLNYDSDTKDDENNGDTNNHDKLYNMANEMQDAPLWHIEDTVGIENAKRLFLFGEEPPKEIPKPKKQFVDPNQMSINFPEPEMRQVAELRKHIRTILREAVRSGKNPFTKYQLSSTQYEDAIKHINNVLKYGDTTFNFSEFDTFKYHAHKSTINAIFDYLALNFHSQKNAVKKRIYAFLLSNLVPTDKSGNLNAIGKIVYKTLNNHISKNYLSEKKLNEEYPGEDLDVLRTVYYHENSGLNKALYNYQYQNASFITFLITVLTQNMIDNHRKKVYQSDGVSQLYKTYSLDEPIDYNRYAGNYTTKDNKTRINYDDYGGPSTPKFADAISSKSDTNDEEDIFHGVDMEKLQRAVLDFILTKLAEHNKTMMLKLFRQMYILGEKDIKKISKALKITPLNVRVTKNRLEAFITNFVKNGEFQKFIKKKTGKEMKFPNNEFKTNKTQLNELSLLNTLLNGNIL